MTEAPHAQLRNGVDRNGTRQRFCKKKKPAAGGGLLTAGGFIPLYGRDATVPFQAYNASYGSGPNGSGCLLAIRQSANNKTASRSPQHICLRSVHFVRD